MRGKPITHALSTHTDLFADLCVCVARFACVAVTPLQPLLTPSTAAEDSTNSTNLTVPMDSDPDWEFEDFKERLDTAIALLNNVGIIAVHNYRQEREVATKIAKSLAPRLGNNVYQVASWTMPIISKMGMCKSLAVNMEEEGGCLTWRLTTFKQMKETVCPLLERFKDVEVFGLSKPLKKPSEKRVRVIATMMPTMEIYATSEVGAMDHISVNLMYALIDQDGEIHPPKSPERAEIILSNEERLELRQTAYADLKKMHLKGVLLSAQFLRLINLQDDAIAVEEEDAKIEKAAVKVQTDREMKKHLTHVHEIETILEEVKTTGRAKSWFKVLWKGYHPSWEPWRIEGEVGTQIATWETKGKVLRTDAYGEWMEAHLPARVLEKRRKLTSSSSETTA